MKIYFTMKNETYFIQKKYKLFLLHYENEMIYESIINDKPNKELNIYSLEIDKRKL